MRKERFLLTAIFLILVLALAQTGLEAGKAKLQISETTWDWGRSPQNAVLSHSFWLKNVGTDTLRALNVSVA
ncbi:MAG: DUF1573 domain-containing protein [candidate division Zixibacteria bacterium]|nr:DUF1573 domain-containing protein [candidate division Zixibacteria bacterium]